MELLHPTIVILITLVQLVRSTQVMHHILVRYPTEDIRPTSLTDTLIADYPPPADQQSTPQRWSSYPPPAATSNFYPAVSPISPVSSPPPHYDVKHEAAHHIDAVSPIQYSDENEIHDEGSLSNWRPSWVIKGGNWILLTILTYLILYVVLYEYGRKKGYIATSNSGTNILFRFGPVFLALIVSIMVERLADGMALLQPYIALTRKSNHHLRNQYGARLTEPSRNEIIRSWRPTWFILPKKLRKWTKLATLWCTLVLVPLQTGLLTKLPIDGTLQSTDFKVLGLSELFNSAFRSGFPKNAIEAVYKGQKVSDFKWVSRMEKTSTPTHRGPQSCPSIHHRYLR
jgi:hypothetical protein